MERSGDYRGALASYRSAGAEGDKMALFDAGRLVIGTSTEPGEVRRALLSLCDCANLESAGFYYVQKDSDAVRMAALVELGRAFEAGLAVEQDPSIAGYLYQQASEAENAGGQWFRDNSRDRDYDEVFRRKGEGRKGVGRMSAFGYGGEVYRWTEITARVRPPQVHSPARGKKEFEIVSMSYDTANRDESIFEYRIPDGVEFTLSSDQAIRREMFAKVKQEYCARHPGANPADVRASTTHYQKTGNSLTYVVTTFRLQPSELDFSAATQRGVLLLRFEGRDFREIQSWVKENLDELVNTQNVVLVSGQRPPRNAKFKVGSMRTIDDGTRLEIHFTAIE